MTFLHVFDTCFVNSTDSSQYVVLINEYLPPVNETCFGGAEISSPEGLSNTPADLGLDAGAQTSSQK